MATPCLSRCHLCTSQSDPGLCTLREHGNHPKSQELVRLWGGGRRRINIRIGGMGHPLPVRWVFSETLLPSQCLPQYSILRQEFLLRTPSHHQPHSFPYHLNLAPPILSHLGLLVSPCSGAGGSVFSTCLSYKSKFILSGLGSQFSLPLSG